MTPAETGNRRITINNNTAQLSVTFETENLARRSYPMAAIMKTSERFPIVVRSFDRSLFFDKAAFTVKLIRTIVNANFFAKPLMNVNRRVQK